MNETASALAERAPTFGVYLSEPQLALFEQYAALLREWNARFNLLGPAAMAALWSRHFLDSLTISRAVPDCAATPYTVLDVGSGAGLPGIPLQIAFPHWQVSLLEVTAKKASFLEHAVHELGLGHCSVLAGRAETLAHDMAYREAYDLCLARAVTHASALTELTLPFVRRGGSAIFYKGDTSIGEELSDAEVPRVILGGGPPSVFPVALADGDARCLVRYGKIGRTPRPLPRGEGIPEHRALTTADGARIGNAAAARDRRQAARGKRRRR